MPAYFKVSLDDRRQIAELIDLGWGNKALANLYDVNYSSAAKWIRTYKALGLDGLLNMDSKHRTYSYETKLAAVRARIDDGLSKQEVMSKYGLACVSALQRWCRAYLEGGPEALKPKPRGRPKGDEGEPKEPESELERLRAENERLRCELEVQKRLKALAEAKRQGVKKPR